MRGETYIQERIRLEDRGYETPCWVWQLGVTEKGYGRGNVPGFGKGVRIHRASYEIHVGPIPDGFVTDHLCCVPACCNPEHLEPVTTGENTRRAINNSGGADGKRLFCKRGHPLSGENVRVAKNGNRFCVTCRRDHARVYMPAWDKKNRPWLKESSKERQRRYRQRKKARAA